MRMEYPCGEAQKHIKREKSPILTVTGKQPGDEGVYAEVLTKEVKRGEIKVFAIS